MIYSLLISRYVRFSRNLSGPRVSTSSFAYWLVASTDCAERGCHCQKQTALGTPRDFASHIFGKVVWDPKKFAKPFTIFLMIGEEEWHCVEGFQPVPGHLTGNLYDALPTILQYPDRATSLVDETKMFDPDFQRRLHPDGTITMNGNRGTLIEYATGGDIKSDIVEVRHATPPTGSRDDLSALPFDWQALALPTVARAENREVFPSIWRVNTVGRHPSGTCTETSLGRYPIAAQYWVYWDRPGRICK